MWAQKNVVQKDLLVREYFWSKEYWVHTFGTKKSCSKECLAKNTLIPKIIGPNKCWVKLNFVNKKYCRSNIVWMELNMGP